MNSRDVLLNPEVCPSVAWAAVRRMFGDRVAGWEAETFRIEFARRLGAVPDALVAKVMAAQTVATCDAWAHRHDVFFAFCLTADGVPATPHDVMHPTVEQLAWGSVEIRALVGHPITEEDGTDPDDVDAAIAVVLIEEGFAHAPTDLAFCRDVFEPLSPADPELRRQTAEAWAHLDALRLDEARRIAAETDEDDLGVQVRRLVDVKAYVDERVKRRATQNATLRAG